MTAAQLTWNDLDEFVWQHIYEIIDIMMHAYNQTLEEIIDVHFADELAEWAEEMEEDKRVWTF